VRWLTPSEVSALVPHIYELIEDREAPEVFTPEAPLLTQHTRTRRRR
jgi:hypothetical protein